MRQLAISNKRARGIKRRLRSLKNWADRFSLNPLAPDGEDAAGVYWRLPVHSSMVEGPHAKPGVKRAVIHELLRAALLLQEGPAAGSESVVVCSISLPALFDSELLLLEKPEALDPLLAASQTEYGHSTCITDSSLCQALGVSLPADWSECGLQDEWNDEGKTQSRQRWYFFRA